MRHTTPPPHCRDISEIGHTVVIRCYYYASTPPRCCYYAVVTIAVVTNHCCYDASTTLLLHTNAVVLRPSQPRVNHESTNASRCNGPPTMTADLASRRDSMVRGLFPPPGALL